LIKKALCYANIERNKLIKKALCYANIKGIIIMNIIPSIDLKDGRCVRLRKGDFDTVHEVATDISATAEDFKRAGAELVHVVDLDAAKSGSIKNREVIKSLCSLSGLKIELGGGLRCMTDLDTADKMGVYRMIIGSAAVSDPGFVAAAVKKYGSRIAVGIDALDGRVKTHGWLNDGGYDTFDFASEMEKLGVETIIYTDISRDGMLSGPPLEGLKTLRSRLKCRLTASGGVKDISDISALKRIGVDSVIIGKAYYAGAIDLAEAIEIGK
jgi:phosphoribosylformimino-5-aminoimidazole carboxamide ribotide isomerase